MAQGKGFLPALQFLTLASALWGHLTVKRGGGALLVLKPIQREAHLAGKLLLYILVHKCIVQIPDFLACVC